MRSKVIWSFLSLVAVSAAALVSGCDNDATIAKSGIGESCDSAADCADGLKCLQGACYKTAPGGGEGGDGNGVGPTPPVLGGEGESCTRRADCEDGLACFNQRCAKDVNGEGGEGNIPTIRLGQLGETCSVSADCDPKLACLPGGFGQAVPLGYLGVCSRPVESYTPTGKSCSAECVEDADCCTLPVALHVAWSAVSVPDVSEPYGTGAQSCAELAELIGASNCATATAGTQLAAQCFAQAAYCECDDTWSCNEGQCSYVADCETDGPNPGGCPQFTRSGAALVLTCDEDSEKCEAPAAPCKKDADCEDQYMLGTNAADICGADDCVCYQQTGCYRACNGPLDCEPGYTCNDDSVCEALPECTTNEDCTFANSDPRLTCVEGSCLRSCITTYDCYGGIGVAALDIASTQVCYEGACHPIGCSSDDQCSTYSSGQYVKMFCVDSAEPGQGGVRSAITD